jgi:hypothetical protein
MACQITRNAAGVQKVTTLQGKPSNLYESLSKVGYITSDTQRLKYYLAAFRIRKEQEFKAGVDTVRDENNEPILFFKPRSVGTSIANSNGTVFYSSIEEAYEADANNQGIEMMTIAFDTTVDLDNMPPGTADRVSALTNIVRVLKGQKASGETFGTIQKDGNNIKLTIPAAFEQGVIMNTLAAFNPDTNEKSLSGFVTKAISSNLLSVATKKLSEIATFKPVEVVKEAFEGGNQRLKDFTYDFIQLQNPARLLKGMFGKRNVDGSIRTAHPSVEGTFATLDKKTAERFQGEEPLSKIDLPAGTTVEYIDKTQQEVSTQQLVTDDMEYMSENKANEIIDKYTGTDNTPGGRRSVWWDWFTGARKENKSRIAYEIDSDFELRRALISNLYNELGEYKKELAEENLTEIQDAEQRQKDELENFEFDGSAADFKKFLNSEITLYRAPTGDNISTETINTEGFASFTIKKYSILRFSDTATIISTKRRVKDLYGAVNLYEVEVMEPMPYSEEFANRLFNQFSQQFSGLSDANIEKLLNTKDTQGAYVGLKLGLEMLKREEEGKTTLRSISLEELRAEETAAINESTAQVVKLRTIDATGQLEDQFIVKDETLRANISPLVEQTISQNVNNIDYEMSKLVESNKIESNCKS